MYTFSSSCCFVPYSCLFSYVSTSATSALLDIVHLQGITKDCAMESGTVSHDGAVVNQNEAVPSAGEITEKPAENWVVESLSTSHEIALVLLMCMTQFCTRKFS